MAKSIGYYEGPENRKYPRTKKQFIVRYRPFKGEAFEGGWSPATTQDISQEGCYFTATAPFENNARIEILMKIPDARGDLKFIGEVRRCNRLSDKVMEVYGVGIQFLRLSPSHDFTITILKTYLDKIIPAES